MGMFLRRGLPSKFTVILSAPVSYSSTYSMYAVVNGEKLTDATALTFHAGSKVPITISYKAPTKSPAKSALPDVSTPKKPS